MDLDVSFTSRSHYFWISTLQRITGLCGYSSFNVWKNFHTTLHKNYTSLHPHKPCTGFLLSTPWHSFVVVCMYMSGKICTQEFRHLQRSEEDSGSPGVRVTVVVSYSTWVLGTKLRSFEKEGCAYKLKYSHQLHQLCSLNIQS